MDTLPILLLTVVMAAAAYAAFVTWRRLARDGRGLRMADALELQGIKLPDVRSHMAASQLANATRRCLTCSEHKRCDEVVAKRDWPGLREICPNTAYMEQLRAKR